MKKSLLIITSFILMCIIFIGCAQTDASITTSKELNKNLNMLSNTVKRLDTIDNEYLMDNELYSLGNISTTPTPHKTTQTLLANSTDVIIEDNENNLKNINLQDELKSALEDEIISRLYCDENGNCKICTNEFYCDDDGICNSCNETIICDELGNCKDCKTTLNFNDKNECTNCNKNCVSNDITNQPSNDTLLKLKRISNINNELKVDKLSLINDTENTSTIVDNIDNNHNVIDNNIIIDDNNSNNSLNNNTNVNSNISTDFEDDFVNTNTNDNLTNQTNNSNIIENNTSNSQEKDINLLDQNLANNNEKPEENLDTTLEENYNNTEEEKEFDLERPIIAVGGHGAIKDGKASVPANSMAYFVI